jgi:chloramphenicol 3-O phosphotransferase
MERRRASWHTGNNADTADGAIPQAVRLWQQAVHAPGIYDLEVDASVLSSEERAALIHQRLTDGPQPSAFQHLVTITTRQKRAAR